MKTYIFIALLFAGLSVYAQSSAPVQPFSNDWPSDNALQSVDDGDPFNDWEDNPDPDPVPIGDSMGWVLILGLGYVAIKYFKAPSRGVRKHKM